MVVWDIDEDGDNDVGQTARIAYLPNRGDGTFADVVVVDDAAVSEYFAVGDLDANGHDDIVSWDGSSSSLSVLLR